MAIRNKTHSGAKKRFRITSKGNAKRSHAGAAHLQSKKNPKTRRKLRSDTIVAKADIKRIRKLLGK